MTKHRWHDEIVAWAGGAEIECQDYGCDDWYLVAAITCFGDEDSIFRIKPQPKEKKYLYVYRQPDGKIIMQEEQAKTVLDSAMYFKYLGKIEIQDD